MGATTFDDILTALNGLDAKTREATLSQAALATRGMRWLPSFGYFWMGLILLLKYGFHKGEPYGQKTTGHGWAAVLPAVGASLRRAPRALVGLGLSLRLWRRGRGVAHAVAERDNEVVRVFSSRPHGRHQDARRAGRRCAAPDLARVQGLGQHEAALWERERQGMALVRRPWHNGVRRLAARLSSLPATHRPTPEREAQHRPDRRRQGLRAWEPPLGNLDRAGPQSEQRTTRILSGGLQALGRDSGTGRHPIPTVQEPRDQRMGH